MRSCATKSSASLKAALPVDGVVLGLHGAMVAQGYDDCEGDLLERVRAIVGPDVVIAAELDPHSHLTPKRVAACRHPGLLPRIPAHRFLRARRACRRAGAARRRAARSSR